MSETPEIVFKVPARVHLDIGVTSKDAVFFTKVMEDGAWLRQDSSGSIELVRVGEHLPFVPTRPTGRRWVLVSVDSVRQEVCIAAELERKTAIDDF